MIDVIVIIAFLVGGLKLMVETRKKHNLYIALGFIFLLRQS
jgi:hypothetical protein